jgi:hypothetical protein
MPHAAPTRSAHRAAPEGLELLVRQAVTATGNLGRQAVSVTGNGLRRTTAARREPQRPMQLVLSGLAGVIMLSICGLSGFFIVADKQHGLDAGPAESPAASSPWAISSRQVDPEPLSLDEIFPTPQIKLVAGADPYRVTMTHIDTDCEIATTGGLGRILADHDCTQVVRAGMTAPYGGYEVTAGVFNLADEAGSAEVAGQLRDLVQGGSGTFASMAVAPGLTPQAEPLSRIGWRERGHYLVYCIITRPDGSQVESDDPYARRITADLVDTYLSDEKLGARALDL